MMKNCKIISLAIVIIFFFTNTFYGIEQADVKVLSKFHIRKALDFNDEGNSLEYKRVLDAASNLPITDIPGVNKKGSWFSLKEWYAHYLEWIEPLLCLSIGYLLGAEVSETHPLIHAFISGVVGGGVFWFGHFIFQGKKVIVEEAHTAGATLLLGALLPIAVLWGTQGIYIIAGMISIFAFLRLTYNNISEPSFLGRIMRYAYARAFLKIAPQTGFHSNLILIINKALYFNEVDKEAALAVWDRFLLPNWKKFNDDEKEDVIKAMFNNPYLASLAWEFVKDNLEGPINNGYFTHSLILISLSYAMKSIDTNVSDSAVIYYLEDIGVRVRVSETFAQVSKDSLKGYLSKLLSLFYEYEKRHPGPISLQSMRMSSFSKIRCFNKNIFAIGSVYRDPQALLLLENIVMALSYSLITQPKRRWLFVVQGVDWFLSHPSDVDTPQAALSIARLFGIDVVDCVIGPLHKKVIDKLLEESFNGITEDDILGYFVLYLKGKSGRSIKEVSHDIEKMLDGKRTKEELDKASNRFKSQSIEVQGRKLKLIIEKAVEIATQLSYEALQERLSNMPDVENVLLIGDNLVVAQLAKLVRDESNGQKGNTGPGSSNFRSYKMSRNQILRKASDFNRGGAAYARARYQDVLRSGLLVSEKRRAVSRHFITYELGTLILIAPVIVVGHIFRMLYRGVIRKRTIALGGEVAEKFTELFLGYFSHYIRDNSIMPMIDIFGNPSGTFFKIQFPRDDINNIMIEGDITYDTYNPGEVSLYDPYVSSDSTTTDIRFKYESVHMGYRSSAADIAERLLGYVQFCDLAELGFSQVGLNNSYENHFKGIIWNSFKKRFEGHIYQVVGSREEERIIASYLVYWDPQKSVFRILDTKKKDILLESRGSCFEAIYDDLLNSLNRMHNPKLLPLVYYQGRYPYQYRVRESDRAVCFSDRTVRGISFLRAGAYLYGSGMSMVGLNRDLIFQMISDGIASDSIDNNSTEPAPNDADFNPNEPVMNPELLQDRIGQLSSNIVHIGTYLARHGDNDIVYDSIKKGLKRLGIPGGFRGKIVREIRDETLRMDNLEEELKRIFSKDGLSEMQEGVSSLPQDFLKSIEKEDKKPDLIKSVSDVIRKSL